MQHPAFQGCSLASRQLLRSRRTAAISSRRPVRCNISNVDQIPLEAIPADGELPPHWGRPGVYGVYNANGSLQYVAAAEDVRRAIAGHRTILQDSNRVHTVRMITVDDATTAPLGDLAENWVVSHTNSTTPPPGNCEAAPEWRVDLEDISPDVTFRPNVSDPELEIKRLLRRYRLVLFMKGTSDRPMCGFSRLAAGIVQSMAGDNLKCVNCLDSVQNPGLRDAIKSFSQWPTIPQLYVNGDFIGGSDIVQAMAESGELQEKVEVALAAPAYYDD